MKKVILASALALGATVAASAQSISFGPRIGVNIARVSMTDGESESQDLFNDNTKALLGGQIGVMANLGITENFSIQPELHFSQQGYKLDYSSTETDPDFPGLPISIAVKENFKTSYLQVPVLAKATFGTDDFKFFVNAGPYVSYWITGKSEREITASAMGFTQSEKEDIDVEFDKNKDMENFDYEFNRLDAGLVAGAGVGIAAGTGTLTFDVRYNMGFSNIVKPVGDDNTKMSNRFIGIGIGYMFGSN